jgi:replication factor C large subunit
LRIPWFVKYRPRTLAEVENQEEAKTALKEWLNSWINGKPTKRAVLLYGPPGVGKTTLAEALARDFGMELFELNASDSRRLQEIQRTATLASLSASLLGSRGKLILLDEVDGMNSREDSGGYTEMLRLLQATRTPIILTANDPWDPSLRELRSSCLMIELKKLGKISSRKVLRRICEKEGIKCDDEAINEIIETTDGDMRYSINILQAVAEGLNHVNANSVRAALRKEKELDPFETLRGVFWAKYAWQARNAVSNSHVDYEMLLRWFDENLPIQMENLEDLSRGYAALSRASLFSSRARYTSWDLLSYVFDLLGPGLAFAETSKLKPGWKAKWKKYQFPQYVSMMSKARSSREARDSVLSKLAKELHCSTTKVKNDVLPFLNSELRKQITEQLQLNEQEVRYLDSTSL